MRTHNLLFSPLVVCVLTTVGAAQDALHTELDLLRRRVAEQEARLQRIESQPQMQRLPPIDGWNTVLPVVETEVLEHRLNALEEYVAGQKLGDASEISDKPTQKWSGRIHADYWGFPGEDDGASFFENGSTTRDVSDRVLFRRIRLGLQGDIGETMLYKSEFDLNVPRDPQIKDVYIGWKNLPYLQTLLLGNQKRPYGLDHINSSRYNVFLERPTVVEAFNQDARRWGVCSYGVSEDERWNWRAGTYLSTDIQSAGAYLASDEATGVGTHHYQAEVAGRLANTIWYDETSDGRGYAHWGVSGTWADTDAQSQALTTAWFRSRAEARTAARWIDTGGIAGADDYGLLGLEGVVNVGRCQVVGEYMYAWVDRPALKDVQVGGGYGYVSYFLTGEHIPWERDSGQLGRLVPFENFFLVDRRSGGRAWGLGAWQIAARYSYGDFTDEDILGGVEHELTVGLNWYWTPYSRWQFNYIYGDIDQRYAQNVSSATGVPAGAAGPGAAHFHVTGMRFCVDF